VRMSGVFERATWPLRKLTWLVEEKVLWPLSDLIRGRGEHAATPGAASAATAPAETSDAGLPKSRPDLRIAVATVGGAAVVGIAVAALVAGLGGGGSEGSPVTPSAPSAAAANGPTASYGSQAAGQGTLQGAKPSFKSASKVTKAEAATNLQAGATTKANASPTAATNSKPSSIPAAGSDDKAALAAAKSFSGAFVLYEVGRSNPKVKKAFAATTTPALAKALKDRPPSQPGSIKVPTAKVQNIVLSPTKKDGRQVEASVSLLRLGAISELRLTLVQRDGKWLISEVRG
jgi:hypothetical protein